MRSTLILFLLILCNCSYATPPKDKYLKLLLRCGLETQLLLKKNPTITFGQDSIRIVSKELYATAKRADIRTITFVTDADTCVVHCEVKPGRYYRIKGLTGNYVDASQTRSNETLTLSTIDNSNIKGTIFYFDNSSFLSYVTGTYIGESGKLNNIGQAGSKWTVTISQDFSDKFIIQDTNNTLLSDNGSERVCTSTGKSTFNELFTIEEITELPVSIGFARYATLYAPVALEIAEGVTAYTVTIKENYASLNEITDGKIPAHTGVVLYAENEGIYNFPICTTDNIIESDLKGSVPSTYYTAKGTYYALACIDGEVGFYRDRVNNNRFQNNSHKAFIYIPAASDIAYYSFRFDGGSTDIIDVVPVNNNPCIYDIQGRKISNIAMPGLYIVNGEKVLIKK